MLALGNNPADAFGNGQGNQNRFAGKASTTSIGGPKAFHVISRYFANYSFRIARNGGDRAGKPRSPSQSKGGDGAI